MRTIGRFLGLLLTVALTYAASPSARAGYIVSTTPGADFFPGGAFSSGNLGGIDVNVENLSLATVYTSTATVPIWDYISNTNVTIDDMANTDTGTIIITITDQTIGPVGTIELSGEVMGNSTGSTHSLSLPTNQFFTMKFNGVNVFVDGKDDYTFTSPNGPYTFHLASPLVGDGTMDNVVNGTRFAGFSLQVITAAPAVVPEPTSLTMLGTGACLVLAARLRRKAGSA